MNLPPIVRPSDHSLSNLAITKQEIIELRVIAAVKLCYIFEHVSGLYSHYTKSLLYKDCVHTAYSVIIGGEVD